MRPRILLQDHVEGSLLGAVLLVPLLFLGLLGETSARGGPAVSDTARPAPRLSVYDSEAGRLLHRYLDSDTYGAHNQNWDAVQDTSGVLYVANTQGVLVYDGHSWRTLPTANRSIARSMATDAQGRVFVGAQRDFGVLRRDSVGRLRFASLLSHVPERHRSFTDVWRTEVTTEGVYFQSRRRLFRWRPDADTMQSWTPATEFQTADVVRDTLFVDVEGRGLMAMHGDSLRLVPGGDRFADQWVRFMLPHGEHGLLVSTGEGLFVRSGASFRPFPTGADDVLRSAWIYKADVLSDGTIAIGTIDRGLLLLAPDGTVRRHLNARDKPVLGLHSDREGGLWALLDGGMIRYALGAPFTEYGPATGLQGSVQDVMRHRGTLYAATNRSTYRLQDRGDSLAFEPVLDLGTQSWALLSVGEDLLVGTVNGLNRRGPTGRVQRLFDAYHVYGLLHSRFDSSRVYAATGRGVRIVTRTDDRWEVGPYVPGLDTEAREFAETENGTLWVGTNFDGVYRVQFGESPDSTTVDHFGPEHGLPPDRVDPQRWNGELIFGTSTGLMRFIPAPEPHFEPITSVEMPPLEPGRGIVRLSTDAQGRVWGFTGHGPGRWVRHDTTWHWAPGSLHRLQGRTLNAVRIEDGGEILWLATQKGLLRYAPGTRRSVATPPVLVHQVRTLDTDSLLTANGASASTPALSHAHNDVHITYGAPSLVEPSDLEYQHRLEGQNPEWSRWTSRTEHRLSNLSPGTYTFAVRARTAHNDTTRVARYAFLIHPPWYRTWWAYVGYGLLGIGLIAGAVSWQTHRLQKRQRELEQAVIDRTEAIREKNEQLASQAERLKELDKAKSRFFANVSHEFRTPLTLIRGPVHKVREHLQRGDVKPSDVAEQLEIAERNTARLQRLINQILGLARMDADTYELAARPTDLKDETIRVARAFEPLADRHGLTLTADTKEASGDVPPVYVDREAFEHVVSNLLSNAIKFTPEGGRVGVTVRESEEVAEVVVRDTGPGIPEDEQDEIFDRFVQGDDAPTREQEGVGIGLAFAKDLVELHGGTITVDSAEGEGATFTVCFPRGRAHLADPHVANTSSPESEPVGAEDVSAVPSDIGTSPSPPDPDGDRSTGREAAPDVTSSSSSSTGAFPATNDSSADQPSTSKIVLVVDDNADVRQYVRSILEPEYTVVEAANGAQGVQMAREQLPDVILADVMMPEMDGTEMTRRMKEDPETAPIPVIMVTARAATQDEVEGLRAGADDYVTKPFDADVLLQRVGGVLTLQERLRRRIEAALREGEALDAEETDAEETDAPSERPAIEREAREVVRQHLTDSNFGVTDLASEMAMSRSTLYRKLKNKADVTPSALITQVRVEQAQTLLEDGEPVTQVAYAVGYDTLSTFSTVFREHVGTAPSAYAG